MAARAHTHAPCTNLRKGILLSCVVTAITWQPCESIQPQPRLHPPTAATAPAPMQAAQQPIPHRPMRRQSATAHPFAADPSQPPRGCIVHDNELPAQASSTPPRKRTKRCRMCTSPEQHLPPSIRHTPQAASVKTRHSEPLHGSRERRSASRLEHTLSNPAGFTCAYCWYPPGVVSPRNVSAEFRHCSRKSK
jgi:hypothetical protein